MFKTCVDLRVLSLYQYYGDVDVLNLLPKCLMMEFN